MLSKKKVFLQSFDQYIDLDLVNSLFPNCDFCFRDGHGRNGLPLFTDALQIKSNFQEDKINLFVLDDAFNSSVDFVSSFLSGHTINLSKFSTPYNHYRIIYNIGVMMEISRMRNSHDTDPIINLIGKGDNIVDLCFTLARLYGKELGINILIPGFSSALAVPWPASMFEPLLSRDFVKVSNAYGRYCGNLVALADEISSHFPTDVIMIDDLENFDSDLYQSEVSHLRDVLENS